MRTLEKPQVKKFEDFLTLLESIDSAAKEVEKKIDFNELEEIDAKKIAAVLHHLIQADGDIDKVDVDHVEECYPQMEEDSDEEEGHLDESASGLMTALGFMGTTMGNMDLVHFICQVVQKKTGKKVNEKEMKRKIDVILSKLKTITGFLAKTLKEFAEWVAKKVFKATDFKAELAGLVALSSTTLALFVIGLTEIAELGEHIHSEASTSSIFALLIGITALLGKSLELKTLGREIAVAIQTELKDKIGGKEATVEEIDDAIEDLEIKGELTIGV
jgi:hypothetical protein